MKKRILSLLSGAKKLDSEIEATNAAIALMRILLQHSCILLAEWFVLNWRDSAYNTETNSILPVDLEKLRKPSDGTLVECLSELLIACQSLGWGNLTTQLFRLVPTSRPCASIVRQRKINLEGILQNFVRIRNQSVSGHGLPGDNYSGAMLDAVGLFIERLSHVLPEISTSGNELFFTSKDGSKHKLKLLRAYEGNLVCYREIRRIFGQKKCKVSVQVQTDLFEKFEDEIVYEVEDILNNTKTNIHPSFEFFEESRDDFWYPLVLVPDRLTTNFTGRSAELKQLQEWAEDLESRACIVYGEGGMGKTTLAVEFVHQLLHGNLDISWQPELITFYTAKQTRWGLDGLEKIRATDVGLVDVAVFIVRALENKFSLDKKWFKNNNSGLIQNLTSYLREDWKINRNSHLLILDNTETMARNDEDVKALGKQIEELAKKVGRVIVTSRRREKFYASPIEMSRFENEESIKFLRIRAEALNIQPILQAGNSRLRNFANKLGNKPIMLEVFVQTLCTPQTSLEKAFNRIKRMLSRDLGEFLFTDAWGRLSDSMKHLFLLMTRISDTHDELQLKLCCNEANVTVMEAMEFFEDSQGIATIARINNRSQITFSYAFVDYCKEKIVIIEDKKLPSKSSINTVTKQYHDLITSDYLPSKKDPLDKAYRHSYARAARLAFKEGRIEDCELYYEEAISEDSNNGLLFDRYANFLFGRGERYYEKALRYSVQATELERINQETWFTRGMIEGGMGKTIDSIRSLNKAIDNGKAKHHCLLQQAHAYINDNPLNRKKAIQCLDETERLIAPDSEKYYQIVNEIRRLRDRIDLRVKFNAQSTSVRSENQTNKALERKE